MACIFKLLSRSHGSIDITTPMNGTFKQTPVTEHFADLEPPVPVKSTAKATGKTKIHRVKKAAPRPVTPPLKAPQIDVAKSTVAISKTAPEQDVHNESRHETISMPIIKIETINASNDGIIDVTREKTAAVRASAGAAVQSKKQAPKPNVPPTQLMFAPNFTSKSGESDDASENSIIMKTISRTTNTIDIPTAIQNESVSAHESNAIKIPAVNELNGHDANGSDGENENRLKTGINDSENGNGGGGGDDDDDDDADVDNNHNNNNDNGNGNDDSGDSESGGDNDNDNDKLHQASTSSSSLLPLQKKTEQHEHSNQPEQMKEQTQSAQAAQPEHQHQHQHQQQQQQQPLTLSSVETIDQSESVPKKRKGIVGERTDEMKMNYIRTYEKNEESQTLIRNAIESNDFLNNMMDKNKDKDRLGAIVSAMYEQELPANSFIIREGEVGSHFYVSANGEFEVLKDNVSLKLFGKGIVFGELAILYKARRFASIKALTPVKVWALERKVFHRIMMLTGRKEREENINFLRSVMFLQGLGTDVLDQVADLLHRQFYPTGETIFEQGDCGDKFYIIRGGVVDVIQSDSQGNQKFLCTLKRGDYFGEQALLTKEKRLASIVATEQGVECLTLDRKAFLNYFGSIKELRARPLGAPSEDANGSKLGVINEKYNNIELSDLEIIGTLGVGGFGRVELVQFQNKETFALKYLKKIDMVQQQQEDHAYNEKYIMATCDSAFIVKLYKTFKNNKYLFFLMEPCLGGDVWSLLQKSKYFDEKAAKFIAGCVVLAFEYLHARHMIYRDLKPENLMFDASGYVKLVDFGFAKILPPSKKTWTFAGTPEYVAPEIILNKGHDRAIDYWALGVFVHELLCGVPPFQGRDHMKTFTQILRGIDVLHMPTRIPKKAQSLIKSLCRQKPIERLGYQKKGVADIKNHEWFANFSWEKLQNQTMTPPLVRPIRSETDLSYFIDYPRDTDEPPDETSGWDLDF